MYKQLKPSAIKELEESGFIVLTVRKGWEHGSERHALPYNINYQIGLDLERIFRCYMYIRDRTVEVTDIEPAPIIFGHKNLVDAYLGIAIRGIVDYTRSLGKSRAIVSSCIPSAPEHLADNGFTLVPKGSFPARATRGSLRV